MPPRLLTEVYAVNPPQDVLAPERHMRALPTSILRLSRSARDWQGIRSCAFLSHAKGHRTELGALLTRESPKSSSGCRLQTKVAAHHGEVGRRGDVPSTAPPPVANRSVRCRLA